MKPKNYLGKTEYSFGMVAWQQKFKDAFDIAEIAEKNQINNLSCLIQ